MARLIVSGFLDNRRSFDRSFRDHGNRSAEFGGAMSELPTSKANTSPLV